MKNKVFIYGLSSSEDFENIRYIGYTNNLHKRKLEHIFDSRKLYTHKQKWIKNVIDSGHKLVVTELLETCEERKGKDEIKIIKLFKSFGAKLVNGNSGGIGGISPSIETRKKSSLAKMGNSWNKGKIPSNINVLRESNKKPKSDIAKLRMSITKKGKRSKLRRLEDSVIIRIFELYNIGKSFSKIISETLLSKSTIANILYTTNYQDVKNKYSLKITREPYKNQFDNIIRPVPYETPPSNER